MGDIKFLIKTTMTKEDYKRFLYLAIFKKNKAIFPVIGLIALAGSLIISLDSQPFNWVKFIIGWALFFLLAIVIIVLKVEMKKAKRIKTDQTGTFDSINSLKFYDDRLVMENEELKSKGELSYSQFFCLMESKDYFIFYYSANQASLIRKKDIEDLNKFKEFILEKFAGSYKSI